MVMRPWRTVRRDKGRFWARFLLLFSLYLALDGLKVYGYSMAFGVFDGA